VGFAALFVEFAAWIHWDLTLLPKLLRYFAMLPVAILATELLTRRADHHLRRSSETAASELQAFTGYAPARIRELWATADKQLAANWESSGVANKSAEEIAEWYRQNSELYMFAISAYNLEYKRIKSNLKMLRNGSGACLDYGAGTGDLILELARRGHRAAYYDVDGVSKRFAQFRAEKYGLQVEFASTKDELRRIAGAAPFDTIFSFDVLEHIPDLAGELDFLISLLSPNGLLIFDVPAGATVSHPMHLNHTLNVREHLQARGMKEVPMRSWRIGKQEKYAFRKAAILAEPAPARAVQ
jgi:2-polyprenyl-3-methyl-5-hydroxy-6-metoxy-1,4-benzoquinol methylase